MWEKKKRGESKWEKEGKKKEVVKGMKEGQAFDHM